VVIVGSEALQRADGGAVISLVQQIADKAKVQVRFQFFFLLCCGCGPDPIFQPGLWFRVFSNAGPYELSFDQKL
jgi:hypothetical protein